MTTSTSLSIYDRLGVPTVINAHTTATRLSGGIMRAEVADAMREATQWTVDMATLEARASELIAGYTGAEAGYVTAGAAAALLLGTAACVTGLDPSRMNRLPDTRGMKNEVVDPRSHPNFFHNAVPAPRAPLSHPPHGRRPSRTAGDARRAARAPRASARHNPPVPRTYPGRPGADAPRALARCSAVSNRSR